MVRLSTVLPHLAGFQLEPMQITADAITVRVAAGDREASCPGCGEHSARVQSRYQRTVVDRPVGGRRVILILQVRRFYCVNGVWGVNTLSGRIFWHSRHASARIGPRMGYSYLTGFSDGGDEAHDTALSWIAHARETHRPAPASAGGMALAEVERRIERVRAL